MLSNNLKNARKKKGMSQEYIANRLHIVRQTVSKWEQGLSVPDAEMLISLAEVLDVSVDELLGEEMSSNTEISDVAKQLSQLNAMLAAGEARKKKYIKYLKYGIVIIVLLLVLGAIYPIWNNIWHEFGENLFRMFNN